MFDSVCRRGIATAALLITGASAHAAFDINVVFSGPPPSAAMTGYFDAAVTFWESVITDYQSPGGPTSLTIQASVVPLALDFLGQAGPTTLTTHGGFTYTTAGIMQFNSLYLPSYGSLFDQVVMHEMAHVIGFGTLWSANGLYATPGQYAGTTALATYQSEFSLPAASFIPVERGGGPGTEDVHWDETDGFALPTGITDAQGRDMRFELMTGWLSPPTFVSQTTIASFADIGYTVNLLPVPEPGTVVLWLLGAPALAAWAKKQRQSR